jgi:protease PrsW
VVVVIAFLLVILGTLPSFAWAEFFTREDCHPEPKRMLVFTFLSGVIITFLVLQVQLFINSGLLSAGIDTHAPVSLLILTLIEEVAKFFAVFLVVFHQKSFDEPIDAMIYMIVAGLGFAAVENIALVFRTVSDPSFGSSAFDIITLRFVGATLLHALTSGIIGYYWGKAILYGKNKVIPIVGGIIIATVLHALFNYLIINFNTIFWPVLFLVIIAAVIFRDFEKFHDKQVTQKYG